MKQIHRQQLADRLLALAATDALQRPDARDRINAVVDSVVHPGEMADLRRVTILLSDLRGFTALAEQHSALAMVQALNRYLARMTEIIVRWGGAIDKFMGDAIMVLFGAPEALQDDVERAIACAIEMQIAMDEVNAENRRQGMAAWYMGIGINTGEVVAGHLGCTLHSEYTVVGEQVNLASRIEAHSLRGQILLSEATWLLAREYIEVGEPNEVCVKGKRSAVRMLELRATRRPRPLAVPRREVRSSARVEVDLPLEFRRLDGKSLAPERLAGHIHDIGYGGMFVRSRAVLQPFDDICFALSLSLMGRELTEIYAKVLRVVPQADGGFGYPVEFTSIEAKAAQSIKAFVDGIVELGRP
ncbi:adenylate/guanylate cyclase domain-containing protein [Pseudorhodoferax sp.]|uniref:adenylate/guanylate cyclase domain-containing protein n=1 Tax=Pseudorhodoferax sp. TaxID=1993553 RepID=UPI0039E540EF